MMQYCASLAGVRQGRKVHSHLRRTSAPWRPWEAEMRLNFPEDPEQECVARIPVHHIPARRPAVQPRSRKMTWYLLLGNLRRPYSNEKYKYSTGTHYKSTRYTKSPCNLHSCHSRDRPCSQAWWPCRAPLN